MSALGALGNNNTPVNGSPFSLLLPIPTDGGPPVDDCGLYYIAISRAPNSPVSPGGLIFAFATPIEISGPDGPGATIAHSGWTPVPVAGPYAIALQAARFPGPCAHDCDGDGSVGVSDLLLLLATWGTVRPCQCDFDGGGTGVSDLLALLAAWGCS